MKSFKEKVLRVVSKIPCHRVIRSDACLPAGRALGGYNRGRDEKIAKLLLEGCVGVIPTDTLYGLVGSTLDEKAVSKIYKLKKRDPRKPLIILIGSLGDLSLFGVRLDPGTMNILKKIWPGRISVILPCRSSKFAYLRREIKTLAFRLPKQNWLVKLLKKTGPLVAPSANPEGSLPANTIREARKYFKDGADFYVDVGRVASPPSTLVGISNGRITVLRRGADFNKLWRKS